MPTVRPQHQSVYRESVRSNRNASGKVIRHIRQALSGIANRESQYYREMSVLLDVHTKVYTIWAEMPDEYTDPEPVVDAENTDTQQE